MSANVAKNAAYKQRTIFRNVLQKEERLPHKVCTVWPASITRPHAAFGTDVTIPGRPGPGEAPQHGALNNRYGFALCPYGIERDDLGGCLTLAVVGLSSRRIAMDVIGLAEAGVDEEHPNADGSLPIITPPITSSELFMKGYFVPEGDDPTEAELTAAEQRRDTWLREQLRKGDNVWNNTGQADRVPPDALLAARLLGVTRPWAPDYAEARSKAQIACPVCRKPVEQGARKCLACNEWLGYEDDGTPYAVNDPERKKRAMATRLEKE